MTGIPVSVSNILLPDIAAYLNSFPTERDQVLKDMEAIAERENIPIVGPLVGAILYQLAHAKSARRIFELGSAIGYSTIWLASAGGPDAEVFYTDSSDENAARAADFFQKAGVADRIQFKVGDALSVFDSTGGDFDLVFNDVDKHDYPKVFEKVLPRLRRGGLLITDNVLWSGRVAKPGAPDDASTAAIQEFNRLAAAEEHCVYSILPVRDGVGVLLKT
jgi:predicted O-methyltransferase YrrM